MESGNGSGHGGAVDRTQKIQTVRGVTPRASWRALQGTGRQRIRAAPEGGEEQPSLETDHFRARSYLPWVKLIVEHESSQT